MAKRTVVTRSSRAKQVETGEFNFTRQMVPALGADGYPAFLREYRSRAWEAFENLPMPTTSDEPWRRTDIRRLNKGAFRLPQVEGAAGLPAAPEELLHPIVDEDYGGQVLLLPEGVSTSLDPKLQDDIINRTEQMTV